MTSSLALLFLVIAIAVVGAVVFVVAIVVVVLLVRAKDPTRNPGGLAPGGDPAHTLTFTVGQSEPHTVVFHFDQTYGWITITVDGEIVIKHLVTATVQLITPFEFQVGRGEIHAVRIEKHRPLLFSFARVQPIKAFVDGVLVAETPR